MEFSSEFLPHEIDPRSDSKGSFLIYLTSAMEVGSDDQQSHFLSFFFLSRAQLKLGNVSFQCCWLVLRKN